MRAGGLAAMPALSFFADGRDLNLLLDRLNADPEIAFIIPDGPLDPEVALSNRLQAAMEGRTEAVFYLPYNIPDDGYRQRWKAVRTVDHLNDGNHSLWHVPAGALPLLTYDGRERTIPDPWAGWTEQSPAADRTTPYFGPAHSAEIRLTLWTRYRRYSEEEKDSLPVLNASWDDEDVLVRSDVQWVGSRYASFESLCSNGRPPAATKRWWNRLRAWFARSATRLYDGRATFWALPSALRRLKGGLAYDCRGWSLTKSLKKAKPRPSDLVSPRPVEIDPDWLKWNGGAVGAIARRIHEERTFNEMGVLADALEEAGCTNQDILTHCRQSGSHGRGCSFGRTCGPTPFSTCCCTRAVE
jgi:hypothetical protein